MHIVFLWRSLAGLALAAAFIAPTLGASPRWRAPMATQNLIFGFAGQPLAAEGLTSLERSFLDRAGELTRHQGALSQLAVGRGSSSEVREVAQLLVLDSRQINDSVAALRQKNPAGETSNVEDPEIFRQLSQLPDGVDFDRGFVQRAAAIESDLLALFEEVMAGAKDAAVRDLVGTHLPALREHRNRLLELKKNLGLD